MRRAEILFFTLSLRNFRPLCPPFIERWRSMTVEHWLASAFPIDPLSIDNNLNSYAFVVCISQSDVFYGARISYTYNNAGD